MASVFVLQVKAL